MVFNHLKLSWNIISVPGIKLINEMSFVWKFLSEIIHSFIYILECLI